MLPNYASLARLVAPLALAATASAAPIVTSSPVAPAPLAQRARAEAVAAPPSPPAIRSEMVASGFFRPIAVMTPPEDASRLFVAENFGTISIVVDGTTLPTPFLDLTTTVTQGGERGLLGMVFHPEFATNGYVYVNYIDLDGDTNIDRYTVSATDPNVADVTTRTTILGPVKQPDPFHNGGAMVFGPDGMMYVGTGDGGGSGPSGPGANGQAPVVHGKILRMDVDAPFPHVPVDNPYRGTVNDTALIWAWGLREPWRFSFDRLTGDMYIGDVGEGTNEEVNFLAYADYSAPDAPERNFGWRCQEGTWCTGLSGCTCDDSALTDPILEFDHSLGCAVIGGYVYRGCAIPELQGMYLYAGFCYTAPAPVYGFRVQHNPILDTYTTTDEVELTTVLEPNGPGSLGRITTFGEDANGELYFCNLIRGEVFKIVPAVLQDCDGNGVADSCDIESGKALDLNRNGVIDSCEGFPRPIFDYFELPTPF